MLDHFAFIAAIIFSIITGYAIAMQQNSGKRGASIVGVLVYTLIGVTGGAVSLIALIIWGFIYLEWYVVVVTFLVAFFVIRPLAFLGGAYVFWYLIIPLPGLISIGITTWLWLR